MTDSDSNKQWQQVEVLIDGTSSADPLRATVRTPVQVQPVQPLHEQYHYMHLLSKGVKPTKPTVPDNKPPSTPIELFDRARQLIANDGWVR